MNVKLKTLIMLCLVFLLSACGGKVETNSLQSQYGHNISTLVKSIIASDKLKFYEKLTNDIHDDYRRYRFTILPISNPENTKDSDKENSLDNYITKKIDSANNNVKTALVNSKQFIVQKFNTLYDSLEKALLRSEKIEIYNKKSQYWDYSLKCSLIKQDNKQDPITDKSRNPTKDTITDENKDKGKNKDSKTKPQTNTKENSTENQDDTAKQKFNCIIYDRHKKTSFKIFH